MDEVSNFGCGGHALTHPSSVASYETQKSFIFSSALVLSSLKDRWWGDLMNFIVDLISKVWEFSGLKVASMAGVKMVIKHV